MLAQILNFLVSEVKSLSRVRLIATPWTVASQAPSSMGFSRQEYWSGVPLPSPGYLSVTPFCFQDFGSFSLSLFGILYQVDSLSLPLLFGLVGIYPVPLSAGYSSVSSCLNC